MLESGPFLQLIAASPRYYQHLGLNKTAIFKFLRKRFGFSGQMKR